jgi:hypothetical protein
MVAAMLPAGAHYVKAFGTLGADSLASAGNREPRRAVLFYATDDDAAAAAIERLISTASTRSRWAAWPTRDESRFRGGDLHQGGGLNGQLLDLDQARAAVAAGRTPTAA